MRAMRVMTTLRSLGPIDGLSVRRDEMLRWMFFLPIVITAAIRLLLPLILSRLDGWLPLALDTLFVPLMGALFFLIVPFLWGMLSGFLLLDQRDDRTLTALQITPLPMSYYLLYRLGMPTLLSAISTMALFPFAGLASLRPLQLVLLALLSAPLAPLVALLLAAFAQNKVQGLAMSKASGLLLIPALAAYFLPGPWRWAAAIVPTFWTAEAFWQALESGTLFWLYVTGGFLYQLLLLAYLGRRFEHIMHR